MLYMVDPDLDDHLEAVYEEECYYCFNSDCRTLIKCIICGKWLCNEKFTNRNTSCLFIHLRSTNHNYLMLNQAIKYSPIILECKLCKYRNCFCLGFSKKTNELYCRIPCKRKRNLNDDQWISLFEHSFMSIPGVNFCFNRLSTLPDDFGSDNDYNSHMEEYRIRLLYESKYIYTYIL
jgi:hypothetical protein